MEVHFYLLLGRSNMPVVHIHMYKGRTKEQKKELVRRITEDFEQVVNVKPESLHILFQDIDKEDWGTRGKLASDL
ncbi:MAG TPA: 2-hydroxymuconate tautomerase family protein [Candidatus Binatia bacterium]